MVNIEAILAPGAIAVIGASPDAEKIRGRIVAALKSGGYGGPVYPVNPAHAEIQGLTAYPSVGAIAAPVEPATTIPSTSPERTSLAEVTTDESGFSRTARAGSSPISITSGA